MARPRRILSAQRALLALAPPFLLAAACHLLAPYMPASQGPQDARADRAFDVLSDGPRRPLDLVEIPDGSTDKAPADISPPDKAPADISPPDKAPVDVSPPDKAPVDISPPDKAPADVSPSDKAPVDVSPQPDQGTVGPGCATGKTVVSVDGKMVFCTSPAGKNQCNAEATFCDTAAGWKLCTATQYLLRFKAQPPPVTLAWIAGCARDGGSPQSPTDTICSQCSLKGGVTTETYQLSCDGSGSGGGSKTSYIGVVSWSGCIRAGVNTPAAQGYWQAIEAGSSMPGAACCLP